MELMTQLLAQTSSESSGVLWLAVVVGLYFLPSLHAASKHHRNTGAVFVVNLFFGWSIIGWVIALAMAAGDPGQPPARGDDAEAVRGILGDALGKCPHCGASVARREQNCWKCKRALTPATVLAWGSAPAGAAASTSDITCPFCMSPVAPGGRKCAHCGEWVVPEAQREGGR